LGEIHTLLKAVSSRDSQLHRGINKRTTETVRNVFFTDLCKYRRVLSPRTTYHW